MKSKLHHLIGSIAVLVGGLLLAPQAMAQSDCRQIVKEATDANEQWYKRYAPENAGDARKNFAGWLQRRSEEAVDPIKMQYFWDDYKKTNYSHPAYAPTETKDRLGWMAVECNAKLIRTGKKPVYVAP